MIKTRFEPLVVIHDSLLPRYRGFNPLVTALLNRDEVIGATALIASSEYDRGDIIASKAVGVRYPARIGDVIESISAVIEELTLEIFEKIRGNSVLIGTPQDESRATYSIWRDRDDYFIDWRQSAEDIAHFVDCVSYPYAGAATYAGDSLVRVMKASPVADVVIENRDPGKVIFADRERPIVICGSGLVRLEQVVDETGANALPLDRFRIRFKSST